MENGGSPGSSSSSLQASMQEFNLFETQSAASNWSLSVMASLVLCRLCSLKCTLFLFLHCVLTILFFFVLPIYVFSGFIKFLGPYYILVITERREIGEICGHRVYEVSKSEIISLRNPSVLSNIPNSRDENRCLDLPYTTLCLFFCLFQAYC
ncbi:unnamed protein product [Brassica napus]|uniref:(rape) hypothetical protein n=1 Tax=Brassica napus TaxID=3708 RepID=A0A816ZJ88_BRANA|nr:unnamed protein product [Brassica napus]